MSASRRALPDRVVAARFLAVGLPLLIAGFVLAWLAANHEPWLRAKDLPTNQWFFDLGQSSAGLRDIANAISFVGAGEVTVPVLVGVVVALLAFRQWRWAVFVLIASQVGFLLSNTTKHLVARPRPPFTVVDLSQVGMSFPSGHTFAGIATWGAFAITVLYLFRRPWSTIAAVTLAGFGLLNGPSRLLLGKHWVSDVIGGILLGAGWLCVVWAGFLWFLAPRSPTPEPAAAEPGTLDTRI